MFIINIFKIWIFNLTLQFILIYREFEDTFQIQLQLDLRKAKFSILSSIHNYTNTIFHLQFCPILRMAYQIFMYIKKKNLQIFKHLKMRVHSLCLWHFNDSISQDLEVIFHQYHHAVRNPICPLLIFMSHFISRVHLRVFLGFIVLVLEKQFWSLWGSMKVVPKSRMTTGWDVNILMVL